MSFSDDDQNRSNFAKNRNTLQILIDHFRIQKVVSLDMDIYKQQQSEVSTSIWDDQNIIKVPSIEQIPQIIYQTLDNLFSQDITNVKSGLLCLQEYIVSTPNQCNLFFAEYGNDVLNILLSMLSNMEPDQILYILIFDLIELMVSSEAKLMDCDMIFRLAQSCCQTYALKIERLSIYILHFIAMMIPLLPSFAHALHENNLWGLISDMIEFIPRFIYQRECLQAEFLVLDMLSKTESIPDDLAPVILSFIFNTPNFLEHDMIVHKLRLLSKLSQYLDEKSLTSLSLFFQSILEQGNNRLIQLLLDYWNFVKIEPANVVIYSDLVAAFFNEEFERLKNDVNLIFPIFRYFSSFLLFSPGYQISPLIIDSSIELFESCTYEQKVSLIEFFQSLMKTVCAEYAIEKGLLEKLISFTWSDSGHFMKIIIVILHQTQSIQGNIVNQPFYETIESLINEYLDETGCSIRLEEILKLTQLPQIENCFFEQLEQMKQNSQPKILGSIN